MGKRQLLSGAVTLFVLFLAFGSSRQSHAKSPFRWQKVDATMPSLQPLLENETVERGDLVLYHAGAFYWSAQRKEDGKTQYGIDVRGEKRAQFIATSGRVQGMAVWGETLVLRLRDSLVQIDPASGEVIKSYALPKMVNRQPIAFWQGKLALVDQNRLLYYNWPESGTELVPAGESKPLPMEKVQRAVVCGDALHLWSSYGGAKIVSIEKPINESRVSAIADIGKATERRTGGDYRWFWKMACDGKTLVTAEVDQSLSTLHRYIQLGQSWLPVTDDMECLNDGAACRHSKREDWLEYYVAPANREFNGVVLLPASETISQRIEEEEMPYGGVIKRDSAGNAALSLNTRITDRPVYRARISRYRVEFNLEARSTAFTDQSIPDTLAAYLADGPQYRITDPVITESRDRLLQDHASVESYINAQYNLVRRSLVYKQDGRFDAAPVVLKNGHGSCTEHSYLQIALLRSAGIPARLAWNWLPTSDTPSFNHKVAEIWTPEYGWIISEPLSSPRKNAGTVYGYHIVFARLAGPRHEFINRGDRLIAHNGKIAEGDRQPELSLKLIPVAGAKSRSMVEMAQPIEPSEPLERGIGNPARGDMVE